MTQKMYNELISILYFIAVGIWLPISKVVSICLVILLVLSLAESIMDTVLKIMRKKAKTNGQ